MHKYNLFSVLSHLHSLELIVNKLKQNLISGDYITKLCLTKIYINLLHFGPADTVLSKSIPLLLLQTETTSFSLLTSECSL
jgi:hypothetical protein